MPPIQTTFATTTAKLVASAAKLLRLGAGTSLPGKIARKLDPHILQNLGKQIKHRTIAVTGTNGKTTTCGLLAQFFRESGNRVVHNHLGANMVPGITAALVSQTGLNGHLSADTGILEVDEASLTGVAQEVSIQHIAVTNLFRDQLDRYGELDTTAKLIADGIAHSQVDEGGSLYLNADDPMVTAIANKVQAKKVVYFGIDEVLYPHQPKLDCPVGFPIECTQCPACGGGIDYSRIIFGHLGSYTCAACGYRRPEPSVCAKKVTVTPEGSQIELALPGHNSLISIDLPLPGLFNVYNLLAAVAVAVDLGITPDQIKAGIAHTQTVFGRSEQKMVNGKHVTVMLIKNPVGATEVLKLVGADPKARLMIALNDNYADGRDVSWIWDAAFEAVQTDKPITVSGVRAEDMALRLKYAGIPEEQLEVVSDLKSAVDNAIQDTQPDETLYILPTYTALLDLRNILP